MVPLAQAPSPNSITMAQLRKVQAKTHALGLSDRGEKLGTVSEILGVKVETLSDLTQSQASVVIDALIERENALPKLQVVDRSLVDHLPTLAFGSDAFTGDTKTGTVFHLPVLVQATNYYSGKPEYDRTGAPKMNLVVLLETAGDDLGGGVATIARRALWAPKPSAMYDAIQKAQQRLGRPMQVGDKLTVKFAGEIPSRNPNYNAAKQYEVTISES